MKKLLLLNWPAKLFCLVLAVIICLLSITG